MLFGIPSRGHGIAVSLVDSVAGAPPRPARSRQISATLIAVVLCIACSLASVAVLPQVAQALTVAKLTAQPNADSGSDVIGGQETRITWEMQAGPDESLDGFPSRCPKGPRTPWTTPA